jgi:hypothetical protein
MSLVTRGGNNYVLLIKTIFVHCAQLGISFNCNWRFEQWRRICEFRVNVWQTSCSEDKAV